MQSSLVSGRPLCEGKVSHEQQAQVKTARYRRSNRQAYPTPTRDSNNFDILIFCDDTLTVIDLSVLFSFSIRQLRSHRRWKIKNRQGTPQTFTRRQVENMSKTRKKAIDLERQGDVVIEYGAKRKTVDHIRLSRSDFRTLFDVVAFTNRTEWAVCEMWFFGTPYRDTYYWFRYSAKMPFWQMSSGPPIYKGSTQEENFMCAKGRNSGFAMTIQKHFDFIIAN